MLSQFSLSTRKYRIKKVRIPGQWNQNTALNNRVLKNIYINSRLAHGSTPLNVEFEVLNNDEDQGYEFIQDSNFNIPMRLLENQWVPKLFGERFTEDFDVKCRMIRKYGRYFFNHPSRNSQDTQIKGIFLASSQPGSNVKCSVIETKMVFEIPYTAVARNIQKLNLPWKRIT